jgi:steroid delta-isomerase-like uncharacterized protein
MAVGPARLSRPSAAIMDVPLTAGRPTMLTAQDVAAVVRAIYEAFNARNMDKSLSLVTSDAKWTNIAFDTDFSGHKGYREYLENWTTAMPDCKVEVVNVVTGDEWSVAECIGRGTHTGPLVGPQGTIPATQKKLDLRFCELLRIKDGQVAEARVYFDAATLMRQLGLLPTPTPTLAPVPVPTPPAPATR